MNRSQETSNRKKQIIRIGCVYRDVEQKYYVQPCVNPKTGQFPDHIRPVNSNGDMILSDDDKNRQSRGEVIFIPQNMLIEIRPGQEFDLSKPYDKAIWEAIEHCPVIASSRTETDENGNYVIDGDDRRYGVAELYVENPEMESQRSVNTEKLKYDAKTFVFNDPRGPEGRLLMCKVLGRNMDGASDADVTDYLIKLADKTPQRIIDIYTGDDLNLRFLFVEAREKKVITIKNKAYVYGDEGQFILGATDEAVINWMKNPANQKILSLIRKEVNPDLADTLNLPDESKKEAADIEEVLAMKPGPKRSK